MTPDEALRELEIFRTEELEFNNGVATPLIEALSLAIREMKHLAQHQTSPVSVFVNERCTLEPHSRVKCSDLFEAWKLWCEDKGFPPSTPPVLGRNLSEVFPDLRVTMPRIDGQRQIRFYAGIRLNETA